jgi:tetratricopeptide (TPR) repeat protein
MSILDGMIQSEVDPQALMKAIGPLVESLFDKTGLNRSPYKKLLDEGLSPAAILGLTKDHRDAIVLQGFRALQAGKVKTARDLFYLLHFIEPLDNRGAYGLGVTYQLQGKVDIAAKLFVQYLALDATCAKGYLRLAECLLTEQELPKAVACLEIAEAESLRGHGDAKTLQSVRKLLAHCRERTAAAATVNNSQ